MQMTCMILRKSHLISCGVPISHICCPCFYSLALPSTWSRPKLLLSLHYCTRFNCHADVTEAAILEMQHDANPASPLKNEKFLCMQTGRSPCFLLPIIPIWSYTLIFQAKELLIFSVTPIKLVRCPRTPWWIGLPPNKIGTGTGFIF